MPYDFVQFNLVGIKWAMILCAIPAFVITFKCRDYRRLEYRGIDIFISIFLNLFQFVKFIIHYKQPLLKFIDYI